MELVPYNPYFIGERALPNRLKGALDRVSFTLGAAGRIALFPERYRHPHRRRSPRGPLVDDHYSGSRRNTWPPTVFDQPQRRVNSRRAYADAVADAGHAPRSTSTFTQFRSTWKTGSGDRGNTTPIRKPRRCAERIVGEAVEPYLRPSSPTYRREIIDSFGGSSGEVDVIFRHCVPSRWPADRARQHPQTGYSGPKDARRR